MCIAPSPASQSTKIEDQKLNVVAIATRGDQLQEQQQKDVKRAIEMGMEAFSQRLELALVRVLDARKARSTGMNQLRVDFMKLVTAILKVSGFM